MAKDGVDWQGLQTTNLKDEAKLFKSFNRDVAPLSNKYNLITWMKWELTSKEVNSFISI